MLSVEVYKVQPRFGLHVDQTCTSVAQNQLSLNASLILLTLVIGPLEHAMDPLVMLLDSHHYTKRTYTLKAINTMISTSSYQILINPRASDLQSLLYI